MVKAATAVSCLGSTPNGSKLKRTSIVETWEPLN
jgi:hypothetical protein